MADLFLALTKDDRREALAVAADRTGRPIHLLEKDAWVVWALQTLFRPSSVSISSSRAAPLFRKPTASSNDFPRMST